MKYPFWTLFFIICYIWYVFVTIMVALRGFKNIKKLIQSIDQKKV